MNIVELNNISMVFSMNKEKLNSLKEYFLQFVKKKIEKERFNALTDVSFNIEKGEVFGIVGLNGGGKSTILKIIAGVYKPTTGTVKTYGTIAPLIELGAGFDMELTARENIYLNGFILGYTREYLKSKFDDIVAFSEIGEFLDVPMKNYSSGMVARIAFSVATCTQPDILIADEILAVGDFLFQEKCENRIKEMVQNGTTVIFVSHSIEQVERICNRCAWIEKGKLKMIGNSAEICKKFREG